MLTHISPLLLSIWSKLHQFNWHKSKLYGTRNSAPVIGKEKIKTFMLKISRSIRLIQLSTKLYPDLTEASMQILMEKLKTVHGEKVGKNIWYKIWKEIWRTRSQQNFRSLHSNNSGILMALWNLLKERWRLNKNETVSRQPSELFTLN